MFRRLAGIVHGSMGGKLQEHELWPMESDKIVPVTRKIWGSKDEFEKLQADIEKAHGIKLFKDE